MNYNHIKIIFFGYLFVIATGTILLMLPFSNIGGLSVINAIFTATSATCVTGLIVTSTSENFTFFGQFIIMMLIQIGGLGYMTIVTLFFLFLKNDLNINDKIVFKTSLGLNDTKSTNTFVKKLVLIVLIIEFIGAVVLSIAFMDKYPTTDAIWLGVFHSISAFNNAGFSLFTDSLMGYDNHLVILGTLMILIVLGGLGYLVLNELHSQKSVSFSRYSLHTRITLITTLFLLIIGIILFLTIEWSNTKIFADMNLYEKLLNGLFLSVNFRTSGFNSVDIGALQESSLFFSTIFMMIGGGQGGTAGGIKVTTFAILIMAVIYRLKESNQQPNIFKRTIEQSIINKSLAVLLTASFLVILCTVLLAETQKLPFMQMLFEAVSAFGTVGVSTGNGDILSMSANFDTFGKSVIIILMLAGRLGIFAFGFLLIGKAKNKHIQYPKGRILI
ncbi:MAG: TrkH family potassium uptake protein [Arcobacteraceae bacterium]|nr:TrkH family potassium uptake protein [Arcobacteraceae bacterium]